MALTRVSASGPLPIKVAPFTGAPILPVGTYFRPGRGHRFRMYPPITVGAKDRATLEEAAQRLVGVLEEIIREEPEQWHLVLPNWPADREGE